MTQYKDTDEEGIRNLLLGRKIVSVDKDKGRLVLDNDVVLSVYPNQGCGGCSEGWYTIDRLNSVENAIMNVTFSVSEYQEQFQIFVYSEMGEMSELLSVSGHDNGFYGTGYYIWVSKVGDFEEVIDDED